MREHGMTPRPTPRAVDPNAEALSSQSDGFDESEHLAHIYELRQVMASHQCGQDTADSAVDLGKGERPNITFKRKEKQSHAPINLLRAGYGMQPSSVQGCSGAVYHSTSFGCWRPHHWPRRAAIEVVESTSFEPIILTTILANCITLAWASPLDPPGTVKQQLIDGFEWLFLCIFTLELVLKIFARGFAFHRHAYLRDAWCQLDFVVVTLAWAPILFPAFQTNLSAIRAVRALRPLRALKRVPGMPTLVQSILKSLPALGSVAALTGCLLGTFGIVGMNLFRGVLHRRCASLGDAPSELAPPELADVVRDAHTLGGMANRSAHRRLHSSGDLAVVEPSTRVTFCHYDPSRCVDQGMTCTYFGANPNSNTASFDSVPAAMIPILQAITFDAWTVPMYDVMDAVGEPAWAYFVGIGMLGGFFAVNLFLAVIVDEFMRTSKVQSAEDYLKASINVHSATYTATSSCSKGAAGCDDGEKGCDPCGYSANIGSQDADEAVEIMDNSSKVDGSTTETAGNVTSFVVDDADAGLPPHWHAEHDGSSGDMYYWRETDGLVQWERPQLTASQRTTKAMHTCRESLRAAMDSRAASNFSTALVLASLLVMCLPYAGQSAQRAAALEIADEVIACAFVVEMALRILAVGCGSYWASGWNQLDGIVVLISLADLILSRLLIGLQLDLSAVRMLRLLRLLRLLRAWPGLFRIVHAFGRAIPQMANLIVLLFLLMLLFALLGMQLFGGLGVSEASRWHFDYFYPAMLTTFFVFTGGWVDALQATADKVGVASAAAFFLPALFTGFFVITNLFIAILLDAFGGVTKGIVDGAEHISSSESKIAGQAESLEGDGVIKSERMIEPECTAAEDMSLGCLSHSSRIRGACLRVVESSSFETFIIICIVFSSICLAIDVPRLNVSSVTKSYVDALNLGFTLFFVAEMGMKVCAYGLLCTPKAYLRSGWNILDMSIVGISLLSLLAGVVPAFGQAKALRVLRILRPLRLLQRVPGMKLVIVSLVKTLPAVAEVCAVVLAFHVVFAVLGMQLFAGKFGSCSDANITSRVQCVSHKTSSATAISPVGQQFHFSHNASSILRTTSMVHTGVSGAPPRWLNPAFGSFDHFFDALLVLYVASTADEWEQLMWAGMDARGAGLAPKRNDFSVAAFFTIAWMLVGSFVALNLFVGAIVDNFRRIKAELQVGGEQGSATVTGEQQQWVEAMQAFVGGRASAAGRKPRSCMRRVIFDLVQGELFEAAIMVIVALNVLGMCLEYEGLETDYPEWAARYHRTMAAFSYVYYAECLLKLWGLGCSYFADAWCRFDFALVCIALADQLLVDALAALFPLPPTALRVLRVARVLRILRLLKRLKRLRNLVFTLIAASPAMINIGGLLALLTFIYAVLGVNMFTYAKEGEALSESRNFHSFGGAMLVLFQCLTGDEWSVIMDDLMVDEARGCDPSPSSGAPSDCGTPLAMPYFLSFSIAGKFIFLNLTVAVILENFSALGSMDAQLISTRDIDDFKDAWMDLDPSSVGTIPTSDLPRLLALVREPLGVRTPADEEDDQRAAQRCSERPMKPPSPAGSTTAAMWPNVMIRTAVYRKALRHCVGLPLIQQDGRVAFRTVLDALVVKAMGLDPISLEGSGRSTKAEEEHSGSRTSSPPMSSRIGCQFKPFTPERRETARVWAEELMMLFIRRKRREWVATPREQRIQVLRQTGRDHESAIQSGKHLSASCKATHSPPQPSLHGLVPAASSGCASGTKAQSPIRPSSLLAIPGASPAVVALPSLSIPPRGTTPRESSISPYGHSVSSARGRQVSFRNHDSTTPVASGIANGVPTDQFRRQSSPGSSGHRARCSQQLPTPARLPSPTHQRSIPLARSTPRTKSANGALRVIV